MIDRYAFEPMKSLWCDKKKYDSWLKVELAVCEVRKELGLLDRETYDLIKKKASFSVKRINEIEKITRHDVLAFTTNVGENLGEYSRYFHQGMTSSDILDTSLSLILQEASLIIIKDIKELMRILKQLAFENKDTIMIGRTHGVHAEPITLGFKFTLWYSEMCRNLKRMENTLEEDVSFGKISGAVGTFAHLEPRLEEMVCSKLGLKAADISSQIIQRDRHAHFVSILAIIASSLEKFATEIRSLQRTEILELEEGFSEGQKGSSAMPHKKNPILCERISGLSRVIRGNALSSLENNNLWHERDISNSSVERIVLPDTTILIDYMLKKFYFVLEKLKINKNNMEKNLRLTKGIIFSQRVLLALTNKGLSREDAYKKVQIKTLKAWEDKNDFKEMLLNDKEIRKYLSDDDINECFDYGYFIRNIDYIYSRVYKKDEPI
ncbi:MAG: adenylosuccinate lyase [Candidatus Caldatribacteriota bacterium]|jgi:adenylosuccinate lyase|nr:adenylosuccinate lyase [Atribacterota bacterium]